MLSTIFSLLLLSPLSHAGSSVSESEARRRLQEDGEKLISFVNKDAQPGKAFMLEWRTVEKEATSTFSVDCSTAVSLCKELDVVSYPTIRLLKRDGSTMRYRGPRKGSNIISFVRRSRQPRLSNLTAAEVEAFAARDDFVIVASVPRDGNGSRRRIESFALGHHDRYSFGITETADAAKAVCHNNIEGTQHTAESLEDVQALQHLLAKCTEPLIPVLSRRNELRHLSGSKSLVYYFHNSEAERAAYTDKMKGLAREYQDYLTLVTVDSGEYPELPRGLGLQSDIGLVVQNLHTGQTFPYNGEIAPDGIESFVVAISEGRVAAWEAPPARQAARDEL